MDGEIITYTEMREALKHASILDALIASEPQVTPLLQPVMNFLYELAWKGQER